MSGAAVLGFPERRSVGEKFLVGRPFLGQVLLGYASCLRDQFQRFGVGVAVRLLQKLLVAVDNRVQNFRAVRGDSPAQRQIKDLMRRADTRLLSVPADYQGVDDLGGELFLAPPFRFVPKKRRANPIGNLLANPAMIPELLEALKVSLFDCLANYLPARDEQHVG